MTPLPEYIEFHEEGPREGFQIEDRVFPLEEKAKLIEALADTGLKQVQVGSFVNPRKVPQMADTEALFAAIKKRPGVRYTALWLNKHGLERALKTPQVDIDGKILLYTTDELSIRNNNCSVVEGQQQQLEWMKIYADNGIEVESVAVMTAFGCNLHGEVSLSAVLDQFKFALDSYRGKNVPHLYLADTMGWANPRSIQERVSAVRELAPASRIGLHLHDTRGMGAANFLAALEVGVDLFDSSVAGLGGCPFANHATKTGAGNICTEDMVLLCQEMGIATGIDLDKLIGAATLAERIIGRDLAGKVMHGGNLAKYRKRSNG